MQIQRKLMTNQHFFLLFEEIKTESDITIYTLASMKINNYLPIFFK